MIYRVLLHPKAAHSLSRLDPIIRQRVKAALEELRESPESKGEPLNPSAYWRIRIGDYRAIFQIDAKSKAVVVLFVGHRSKVYDDFRRLF